ncbi:MAG: terminase small subunit, partial [Bacteroidota bacterium]
MPKTDGLTPKQAKFVEEYLVDLNATQAAIRAGYAESGARTEGSRLLANADIIDAINARREAIAKTTSITPERIMREYGRIGFADIRKAVKWRSNILAEVKDPDTGEAAGIHTTDIEFVDSEQLDDDTALAISEVAKDARGGLKLKMHDKKT